MKFIVSRTTVSLRKSKKPCDEAMEVELTPLDYRTVKTLEEAKKKVWYKDWLEGGINHREEGGLVVCDKKIKEKQWVVEINTLEQLIEFQSKYGDIQITDSAPYKEIKKEIKILEQRKN
jgi:GTP:adenosylcobinamide-phosphate guanylyltransferase